MGIFKVTCSVTNWITASILRRRTRMAALGRSQVFVAHLLRCYTIVCVALIGPAFIMMVSLGLASDVVGFFWHNGDNGVADTACCLFLPLHCSGHVNENRKRRPPTTSSCVLCVRAAAGIPQAGVGGRPLESC